MITEEWSQTKGGDAMPLFCENCDELLAAGIVPPVRCPTCPPPYKEAKMCGTAGYYLCICGEGFTDLSTKLLHIEKCSEALAAANRVGSDAAASHKAEEVHKSATTRA